MSKSNKDRKWEVCSFCGELFKGDKITEFKPHWEKCRDEYEEDNDINNYDWENAYY